MKKYLIVVILSFVSLSAKADFWGADLPLLAEIVSNTLASMYELQRQSELMDDELRGLNDKIVRIKTIQELVQPNQWEAWKDPKEALVRIQKIYFTLPKEYRSEKSDLIESEISKAFNLISVIQKDSKNVFESGKEIEKRALDSSPGVAQKLTASSLGTLISQQAQSQVLQSQMVSLLTQMLADGHEKETRFIAAMGSYYFNLSDSLSSKIYKFSTTALGIGGRQ